ncbi:MAG: S8 family serine peptidase [Dehalococcoidales bacterium]|nr:S8 family serine peptidase [Dehalococcoidales bacterium]
MVLAIATPLVVFQSGIGYISAADTAESTDPSLVKQVETITCDNTLVEPKSVESDSLAGSVTVQAISSEPVLSIPETTTDYDNQWALDKIGIYDLWQNTTGSWDILVAVLDTGIDSNHEDLHGQIVDDINVTDSSTAQDIHGHGTHIAGIIAAKSNGTGITGVAPDSRILNVKVADDMGRCNASALAKGIIYAVDKGASVINISVEIREASPELEKAVNYAWEMGSLVVAASGNDGNDSLVYPAGYDNCIAVAATNQNDGLAVLSNYGDWVDVAAPGFGIYSTLPDDGYGLKTGTSFACAYVSGMAALLFDIVVDINGNGRLNDEVRAAIEAGCQKIDTDGVGKGRIDATGTAAHLYDNS